ncbi:MAG: MFS transporter [Neisseria sp.]|nr:MFS transporter [Neisseria sp.]
MSSDFSFARSRRFAPLFGTQFLGAFNDNFFKTTVFVLITYHGLSGQSSLPPAQWLNFGMLLFILPYFLFSAFSGEISTRFDKALIARAVKVIEVAIMLLAVVGFVRNSVWLLMLCLFLMGTHSTLFGPLKYAILPDYLQRDELILGNGLIESGTFIAILLGQFTGSALAGINPWVISIALLIVAGSGLVSSWFMPRVGAKNPHAPIHANIVKSSKNLLRETFKHVELATAIIGISWFWFLGAVYTTQLPTFTEIHLGGNQNVFNLMLTLFSVGIGAGSVWCAKLCHGHLNLRLVLFGAAGMAIFGTVLAFATFGRHQGELVGLGQFLQQPRAYTVIVCIAALGLCGGFFSVPLYTWLQTASSETFRAHAIAANNIVNGVFMVAAALISAILMWLAHNVSLLYLLTALGNLAAIFILVKLSPKMWESR